MSSWNRPLHAQVTVGRGFVDLVLSGDLDVGSAAAVRRVLDRVERIEGRLLLHLVGSTGTTLDLAAWDGFADGTGLWARTRPAGSPSPGGRGNSTDSCGRLVS